MEKMVWAEKYRPRKLEDMLLPDNYRKDFEKFINNKEIPHLLFYGPPGGGKTTLAKILTTKGIILNYTSDNVLKLNGSAQGTRGIGFVEKIIQPFLSSIPMGDDKIKIVFIDEGDKLTSDAFDSLRNILEKYIENGRFIITCNYIGKIPDPLQSRFGSGIYKFETISQDIVLEKCIEILKNENIKYKEDDIKIIIKELHPDIRKIIGTLQRNSYSGELIINTDEKINISNYILSLTLKIIDDIMSGNLKGIQNNIETILKQLADNDLSYELLYYNLFVNDRIPANAKVTINKYGIMHQNCIIPHMNYIAMIYEIIKVIEKYNRLIKS